jgi:hypothetical protein
MTPARPTKSSSRWFMYSAQVAALSVGVALCVPTEIIYAKKLLAAHVTLWAWFLEWRLDTTLPLILLLLAPSIWFVRRRTSGDQQPSSIRCGQSPAPRRPAPGAVDKGARSRPFVLALCCALTAVGASAWVASQRVGERPGVRFGDLPPAYHDEFSYLLQAKTFLAGRLSFPSNSDVPEIFDQMHVLNVGRFASRYFPGVGAWIAPFLAVGHAYWAQWLAAGLAAFFTFWAGRELAGDAVGFLAGMLTALSPGIALFSNLLLSHLPTIAALSLFLYAFLRFMRTNSKVDALWAGCGLSFAMLCRPMTAAGVGLPFGLWFLWWLIAGAQAAPVAESAEAPGTKTALAERWRATAALGAPMLLGLVILFVYDYEITGNGLVSSYQLYTDTYTPRHVYGFNNVVRGEQHLGPHVLDTYDRWAENLTLSLAVKNSFLRLQASSEWTLGVVPLAMAAVVFLWILPCRIDSRWWLVGASLVTLHAVHVPYWFVGIMNWHYVFESGPLLLLIFAVVTKELVAWWRGEGRILMPGWWSALALSAIVMNWLPNSVGSDWFDPFWSTSRIDAGIDEVAFARLRYEGFQHMLDTAVTRRPALVLIEGDPADRSIDYVVNDPDLAGPVIRGRYRPGKTDLAKVHAAFPDRTIYLFRVKSRELQVIDEWAAQSR